MQMSGNQALSLPTSSVGRLFDAIAALVGLREEAVREFVARAGREGGRAIVIPYRVQGFGPYAKALDGLDYVSDGRGLVPHPQVTEWVRREAEALREGGFDPIAD